MARIKMDISGKTMACIQVPVRITDMNYGNHLGNDSLVSIIHEARVAWLAGLGYTELNIEGAGLIMSELIVSYTHESFYGDILQISISAGEISGSGFELFYLVETTREDKKLVIAKAKTGMVCFDYKHKKVVAVPEPLKKLLSN